MPGSLAKSTASVVKGPRGRSLERLEGLSPRLEEHRRRAEVIVTIIQFAIVTVFTFLYLLYRQQEAYGTGIGFIPFSIAIYVLMTGWRLAVSLRRPLMGWEVHFSTAFDFTLLYCVIFSIHVQYGQPAAIYLKSPTLMYAFIFISLRAIRLEEVHVLTAGACAMVGWILLSIYAAHGTGAALVTGDFSTYLRQPAVHFGAEAEKVMTMAIVTLVMMISVRRGRSLLVYQINAERSAALAANTDKLTGVHNRAWLQGEVARRIARTADGWLMLLDIDRFSRLNDSLGYETGDMMLRVLATRGAELPATRGACARIGADMFALVLRADADLRAIHEQMADEVECGNRSLSITMSAGVRRIEPGCGAEEILRDASTALHRAKEGGRGGFQLFQAEQRGSLRSKVAIELDLRSALKRNQFIVYYQPIVRLANRQVAGFEALLRWNHPEKGIIAPVDFIPILEDTGQIVPVGAWVLKESAAALKAVQALASTGTDLFMSVNVSPVQLRQPDILHSAVEASISFCGPNLKLEVTESMIIDDPTSAATQLSRLRAVGVGLSLDDFGTGHSSLGVLHRLPFQTLKLDRSFVRGLDDQRSVPTIKAVISMASEMGLEVVAEGIEDEAEAACLAAMGCTFGQGYLFGRPQPMQTTVETLSGLSTHQ